MAASNAFAQLPNNATTTLLSSINDTVTSLQLTNAISFPEEGDFYIKINSETMLATARSGDTLTVVRGVEGTTAASHTGGDDIVAYSTESMLVNYFREQWVHGPNSPRLAITNPSTRLRITASAFTWVNQGGATIADRDGHLLMTAPTNASGDQFRGLFLSAPTPPYAIVQGFNFFSKKGGTLTTNGPFPQAELLFRESSTGKLFTMSQLPRGESGDAETLQIKTMTNETTFLANKVHVNWEYGEGPCWFKIEDDNTDLKFSVGINGKDWIELYSEGRTSHMAGGPNQVGFGINQSGNNTHTAMMEILHFGLDE